MLIVVMFREGKLIRVLALLKGEGTRRIKRWSDGFSSID